MGNTFKSILVWVALGIGLMAAFNALDGKKEDNGQIEYSQFIRQVNNGEVSGVN
ncbi:ATP-dependent metallopeptidase FtsH/Yme1/Tma family protein, partial [Neisseria gonorrhoeae]